MALIIFFAILASTVIGFGLGRYSVTRANSKSALNSVERAELNSYREMSDELLDMSLERIEVEPFAAVILDKIREHTRKKLN